MDVVFLISILGGIVASCYFYLIRNYSYWRKQGIPCEKGTLPGIGNMWSTIFLRESFADFVRRIYESNSNRSMIGFYNKTTPALLVREVELVRTVMQTDFASFSKNFLQLDPHLNPLLARSPFFTSGDTWYANRKCITNAFSNKKLKMLFGHIQHACEKLECYLDQRLAENNGAVELELRDLVFMYNGEAAAGADFSLEGSFFEEGSCSFFALGKSMFEPTFRSVVTEILNFFLPEINAVLRVPYIPKQLDRFFCNVVSEVLRTRRRENTSKHDLLQVMRDMQDTDDERVDESILAAYTLNFFINMYDSTNATISFTAYELARHPHIQRRLRDEVMSVLAKHDDRLTHESLKEMTYLEQVISESQRLHAPTGAIGKTCTEEIELKGSDGLRCRVQPGSSIVIPIFGLHNDPKYWPDPNVFDPERFGAHRRGEIKRYAFLPFGDGPRICPGRRMALMQTKACLATIVRKYCLETSSRNCEPCKMEPGRFLTEPIDGLWAYVKAL